MSISLIDWEYAGMSDYANDFGTYTVCCELSTEEAEEALSFYFGRTPTFEGTASQLRVRGIRRLVLVRLVAHEGSRATWWANGSTSTIAMPSGT